MKLQCCAAVRLTSAASAPLKLQVESVAQRNGAEFQMKRANLDWAEDWLDRWMHGVHESLQNTNLPIKQPHQPRFLLLGPIRITGGAQHGLLSFLRVDPLWFLCGHRLFLINVSTSHVFLFICSENASRRTKTNKNRGRCHTFSCKHSCVMSLDDRLLVNVKDLPKKKKKRNVHLMRLTSWF